MDKEEVINYYNEIERKRKEENIMQEQVRKIDREIQLEIEQYRNKSVARVLEYINDKCWEKKDMNKAVGCRILANNLRKDIGESEI